ncbi:hypothetical protein C7B76_29315 [filamentous cyanobacterium CCP2]|nr:hypothetical protein C7B76_29315 [filamentous cyanobacterium CCP2]
MGKPAEITPTIYDRNTSNPLPIHSSIGVFGDASVCQWFFWGTQVVIPTLNLGQSTQQAASLKELR